MKRHILYLVNPIAGTRSKQDLESFLQEKTAQAGIDFSVYHSTADFKSRTLKSWISEHKATDVVVCGGDGTVNTIARALQHSNVNLGIIPVGSGNGLARCAEIPLKPAKALDIVLSGKVLEVDAFDINNYFSCMLSGIGFDAAVAERFAKGTKRGLYAYTTKAVVEFFKANPYQFKIELPDFSFYTDAFFISIANSNQFGNNFTIAPKASLSDGLLDIVIVQKMPKAGLPLAILRQLRGNNKLHSLAEAVGKKNVIYFQTPEITIRNGQHAPMHVDGDPCETADDITAKIKPGAIRLLVP
jgi:YegS/Rv2252/BmrU family lipid kinase